MQTWSPLTFQLLPFWNSYHFCENETFNAYNSNKAFFILKSLVDHSPFKGAHESSFTKVIQGWNPSKSPSSHHGILLLSQTFIAITRKTCHHWAWCMWQQYFQIFIQGAIWFASTSGHLELTSLTSSFTSRTNRLAKSLEPNWH